jgi:phosphoesterase RecJ-like protein
MGDTGSFRYSNTTAETHEYAAQLLRNGAKPVDIATGLYGASPLGAVKLQAEAILNMNLHLDGKIAEVLITQDMYKRYGTTREYTVFMVEKARDIEGVQAAIFIAEETDYWKVSLRSRPGTWNVSEIACRFGGGGHVQAAGFRFRGTQEELRSQLLACYEEES